MPFTWKPEGYQMGRTADGHRVVVLSHPTGAQATCIEPRLDEILALLNRDDEIATLRQAIAVLAEALLRYGFRKPAVDNQEWNAIVAARAAVDANPIAAAAVEAARRTT